MISVSLKEPCEWDQKIKKMQEKGDYKQEEFYVPYTMIRELQVCILPYIKVFFGGYSTLCPYKKATPHHLKEGDHMVENTSSQHKED